LKKNGELPKRVRVRTSKYLNNGIEQDHRRVKHRIGAMVGLKSFSTAGVTISGIELTEKIRKGQVQDWQTRWQQSHDARDLTSCAGFLTRDHYK
jgi:transposase-like protein